MINIKTLDDRRCSPNVRGVYGLISRLMNTLKLLYFLFFPASAYQHTAEKSITRAVFTLAYAALSIYLALLKMGTSISFNTL